MPSSSVELLNRIYALYREKRLDDVMALVADDFRFTVHLPSGSVPGAGVSHGKAATTAMLQAFMDSYKFLTYDPGPILAEGNLAASRPVIRYRHKGTGDIIETRLAHFWTLRDGVPISLDEYHDVANVQAYLTKLSPPG